MLEKRETMRKRIEEAYTEKNKKRYPKPYIHTKDQPW
jgi:hypothetical protein